MSFDFSLILLIFSAITGVVWLFDVLVLKRPRMKKSRNSLAQKDSGERFQGFSELSVDWYKKRSQR